MTLLKRIWSTLFGLVGLFAALVLIFWRASQWKKGEKK